MNYLQIGIDIILVGFLVYLSVRDIRSHVIKNTVLLTMLPFAAIRAVICCAGSETPFMTLFSHIGGAVIAFCIFLAVAMISNGRNVGGGDIKLAGILGLCAGLEGFLITMLCGMLAASVGGLVLGYIYKTRHVMIPLAPFMAVGYLIYLLHPLYLPLLTSVV